MRFRLCLAVDLTVYFANHIVGQAFVNDVFLNLFGEGQSGLQIRCLSTFACCCSKTEVFDP